MAAKSRYVPPRDPSDIPIEELILFLEAVSKVTNAFIELRNDILPQCSKGVYPFKEITKWQKRWHLHIEQIGLYLGERIETWIFRVLDWWRTCPTAAQSNPPRVDCDWWARNSRDSVMASDKPMVEAQVTQWNSERESFDTYASRVRQNLERFLDEQKLAGKKEMAEWNMRPFDVRGRSGTDSLASFEWLALSWCKKFTDGQIANRYKVSRQRVKSARRRLEVRMQFPQKVGA